MLTVCVLLYIVLINLCKFLIHFLQQFILYVVHDSCKVNTLVIENDRLLVLVITVFVANVILENARVCIEQEAEFAGQPFLTLVHCQCVFLQLLGLLTGESTLVTLIWLYLLVKVDMEGDIFLRLCSEVTVNTGFFHVVCVDVSGEVFI